MPGGRPKKPIPTRRRRGTGSVGTRRDGRVFCILPADLDPGRRPIYSVARRAFRSEAEAAAWLDAEITRQEHHKSAGGAGGAGEPLAVYLARWHLAGVQLWPPRTAGAYKRSLALLVPLLGAIPLSELTHVRIREALSSLLAGSWQRRRADGTVTRTTPYSRRTVEHARMVLGIALQDLVPEVLPFNPVRRAKLPKAQVQEQPVWDAAEAEAFLDAADTIAPRLALAYRLILQRALRHGEVLALRHDDLDERRGVLVIDETAGARAGETGDTKGRRRREIPLSADLIARLKAYKAAQRPPSPWIFANPDTGLSWVHNVLNRHIPEIARHAGVPLISPKDMRATCATALLLGGRPLPEVSQLLGHSSIAVTSTFYHRVLRHSDERVSRVADDMDAALERAAESARGETPKPIRRSSVD